MVVIVKLNKTVNEFVKKKGKYNQVFLIIIIIVISGFYIIGNYELFVTVNGMHTLLLINLNPIKS